MSKPSFDVKERATAPPPSLSTVELRDGDQKSESQQLSLLWRREFTELLTQLKPKDAEVKRLEAAFAKVKLAVEQSSKRRKVAIELCGSTAKGTNRQKNEELDVVVVFDTHFPIPKTTRDEMLQELKTVFEKTSGVMNVQLNVRSVQMLVDGVEVDLLPAAPLPDGSPVAFLALDKETRSHSYPSAAMLQRDFIKSQPATYKDLVRVVKMWRDEKNWGAYTNVPKSYLLELLSLHAFQQCALSPAFVLLPVTTKLTTVFRQFLAFSAEADKKREVVCWNVHYSKDAAAQACDRLVVVDPCNPTNDVAESLPSWREFAAYAEASLKKFEDSVVAQLLGRVGQLEQENATLKQKLVDAEKRLADADLKLEQKLDLVTKRLTALSGITSRGFQGSEAITFQFDEKTWKELRGNADYHCSASFGFLGLPWRLTMINEKKERNYYGGSDRGVFMSLGVNKDELKGVLGDLPARMVFAYELKVRSKDSDHDYHARQLTSSADAVVTFGSGFLFENAEVPENCGPKFFGSICFLGTVQRR